MTLASKFQLKPRQEVESVLVPESVEPGLTELTLVEGGQQGGAVLVFVVDRSTLEEHRTQIVEAASADRLTWESYPKSGQLATDLNHDSLAALTTESGIRPVRQIAVDGIWSALRFRPG